MSSWIWVLDSLSGPFHPFGGAVDIIVVQQPDGSFKSSPWYVRFGKFQGVLKAKEKVVNININGVESDLQMFLNHRGEAYFLMELDMEEGAESILSPSSSGEDTDSQSSARRSLKSKSYNYDSVTVSNGKVLGRTGSRRSRIMGFVFGRRSMEEQFLEEESGDSVVKAESLERAKIAADLLDVKWSTNLPSNRLKKDDSSSQNCRSDRDEPETIVVKNDLEMSCFVSDSTQIETLQNENTFVSEVDTVSTVCQVQDEQNIPAEMTEISSPEVSPEDQLIFGDLDEDVAEGFDSNNGSDSHPDIVQENLDNECDDSIQNRREKSDNINIPRINKVVKEVEVETMMNSLPVIRSHRSDFDGVGVDRSFGRSLDSSSSAVSKWMMLREDVTSIIKSDLDNNYKVSRAGNEIEDAEVSEVMKNVPLINPAAGDPLKGSWGLWPFRRSGRVNVSQPALDSIKKSNTKNGSSSSKSETNGEKSEPKPNFNKNKKRTTTPTSEQLASLNLKEGNNKVTFMYSTSMWGKQQVDARIYLWRWDTRIVISDVDGTITKSDVLGQFMPLVGKDWSQTGVAHLFSAIKENGYQLLFLSARAISQAFHTRQFLVNLKQDGKALPDGPVVISPNGLFPSLFREVIRRAPHEFKITCLEDIRALFPSDRNPFYAGFGNRDTDEISYVKVGIPKGKIFIINPKGEVAVNRRVDTKSYSSLHALVHGMFPPVPSEQEDFNSWNYWRLPPPGIDI